LILHGRIVHAQELIERNATVTVLSSDLVDQAPVTTRPARIVASALVDAHLEAERVRQTGAAEAATMIEEAQRAALAIRDEAAREARETALAKLSGEHLLLRAREQSLAERTVDRSIAIAVMLAERLLGAQFEHDASAIKPLARQALAATQGARDLVIEVHPGDVQALTELLGELATVAELQQAPELSRGSLVITTSMGQVDGRLTTQLARLGAALRGPLLAQAQQAAREREREPEPEREGGSP
jgi:flagellar biosynthesis/type III secretory pathway protein FliH